MSKAIWAILSFVLATTVWAGYETGTAYQVLRVPSGGGRPVYGSLSLAQSAAVTGALGSTNGGTGQNWSASSGRPKVASGTFSLANIDLTSEVTGALPAANMPALTGDVTSSAGAVATTAAATQANIVTLSRAAGVAVHGTNTNDDAAAGYVGQYLSISNTSQAFPTSAQYGDCGGTSLTLTAGDWDVSLVGSASSATTSTAGFIFGISTTTGNSSTGLIVGDNEVNEQFNLVTNSGFNSVAIPAYRMSVSGSTIIYCKIEATYTGSPTYSFRMSARRVR